MLKQISIKQLKNEALMVSEVNMPLHPHDIMRVIIVFLH